MLYVNFILALVCSTAFGVDYPLVLPEIERLEKAASLSEKDQERLAELYFLTSQCEKIQATSKIKTQSEKIKKLRCACSDVCKNLDQIHDVAFKEVLKFKQQLQNTSDWFDVMVQKQWKKVSAHPEAKYFALKHLQKPQYSSGQLYLRTLKVRTELEQGLDALEKKRHGSR